MKYIQYAFWTVFSVLLLIICIMVTDMLNVRLGYYYEGYVAIKFNSFSYHNIQLIKNTIKYYNKHFTPCVTNTTLEYTDESYFIVNIKGKNLTAVGVEYGSNNIFISNKIRVASKNIKLCDIVETTIHELEHACFKIDDCYGNKDCWSDKLYRNRFKYCNDIYNMGIDE